VFVFYVEYSFADACCIIDESYNVRVCKMNNIYSPEEFRIIIRLNGPLLQILLAKQKRAVIVRSKPFMHML